MLKKIVILISILTLSCMCFTACGSKDNSSTNNVNAENEVEDVAVEETEDVVEEIDSDVDASAEEEDVLALMRLSYDTPKGYKLTDAANYADESLDLSYENSSYDIISISCHRGMADPSWLEIESDAEGGFEYVDIEDYTTANGISGVRYTSKDSGVQWFVFLDSEDYYLVNGTNSEDVMSFVDSIKVSK